VTMVPLKNSKNAKNRNVVVKNCEPGKDSCLPEKGEVAWSTDKSLAHNEDMEGDISYRLVVTTWGNEGTKKMTPKCTVSVDKLKIKLHDASKQDTEQEDSEMDSEEDPEQDSEEDSEELKCVDCESDSEGPEATTIAPEDPTDPTTISPVDPYESTTLAPEDFDEPTTAEPQPVDPSQPEDITTTEETIIPMPPSPPPSPPAYPGDDACRPCQTMCSPCKACAGSQEGECKKCWQCWDWDDDELEDDDRIWMTTVMRSTRTMTGTMKRYAVLPMVPRISHDVLPGATEDGDHHLSPLWIAEHAGLTAWVRCRQSERFMSSW